jgi:hypothetical protein
MTDSEINQLLASVLDEFASRFEMRHQPPSVDAGGHALDVDSASSLGTISIWKTGAIDWQFVDAKTGADTLVGSQVCETLPALREVVLSVLKQVTDSTSRTADSTP